MPSPQQSSRPLRTDAARNREAILCAAAEVYAARGTEVSLEEVARRAGVGVGTIYRRFPTKQALIEALLNGKMTAYAERAESAAARARIAPWEAFEEYVRFVVEQQVGNTAFSEVMRSPGDAPAVFREQHRRALRASILLVKRAERAGVLVRGFRHSDLLMLVDAVHGLILAERPTTEDVAARLSGYLLRAFRATA